MKEFKTHPCIGWCLLFSANSWMTCNHIKKMINFFVIKHCNLGGTFGTFDRVKKFFQVFIVTLWLLAFLLFLSCFWIGQFFRMIDDTVHDKHGSVLVLVSFMPLAIQTQNAEASRTVENSVACTDGSRFCVFFSPPGGCTETRNKQHLPKIDEFEKNDVQGFRLCLN